MSTSLTSKTRSSSKTRRSLDMSTLSSESQACPLCRIIGNEKVEETFRLPDTTSRNKALWKFFIVATKNKKGHSHRYMVVLQDHVRNIGSETESSAIARFFKFMRQFGVDFAIMESTHATIGDHWHRVGTDLNPSAEDAAQILDTERFEVRFRKAGS